MVPVAKGMAPIAAGLHFNEEGGRGRATDADGQGEYSRFDDLRLQHDQNAGAPSASGAGDLRWSAQPINELDILLGTWGRGSRLPLQLAFASLRLRCRGRRAAT